ncbi:MAG: pirin family protein, partial [Actinomycetota bacterium]
MPAVTVEDTLSLPKISSVIPPETLRPIRSINTAARGFEGEGFPVARAFTGVSVEDLDPFIHMDQ